VGCNMFKQVECKNQNDLEQACKEYGCGCYINYGEELTNVFNRLNSTYPIICELIFKNSSLYINKYLGCDFITKDTMMSAYFLNVLIDEIYYKNHIINEKLEYICKK
jgi:hypothetical protein